MSIKIPDGVVPITDRRLNLINILSSLTKEDGYLSTQKKAVKKTMADKKATFAQSDFIVARLQAHGSKSYVDPKKLFALVKSRQISMDQFLDCVCVRSEPLGEFLSKEQIREISKTPVGAGDSKSLVTELKPGFMLDLESVEEAITAAVRPIQAG